jgi:8-oxo-dGTP diphosphatase
MADWRKTQHVAVGIVVDTDQRILISKRPAHKIKGGFWEFPGGKIEDGETPEEALARELQEEVGIHLLECEKLMQYHYAYEEYDALLEIYIVKGYEGVPQSLENQEIQWISDTQFPDYMFLEANKKIIELYLSHIPRIFSKNNSFF